jgi:hypothetical protein
MMSAALQDRPPLFADFSRANRLNQLQSGQENMGDISALSYGSLQRNP